MVDKVVIKPPKLPKSLGACVDLYHDKREERLAQGRIVDAMKANEQIIANHIIDNVPKGDSGCVGKRFKGVVKTETVYQAEEWEKLYAYIKKNDAWDILNRALNQAALTDRINALNEKLDLANAKLPQKDRKPRKMLPGIKPVGVVKLSVTKL